MPDAANAELGAQKGWPTGKQFNKGDLVPFTSSWELKKHHFIPAIHPSTALGRSISNSWNVKEKNPEGRLVKALQ